MLHKIYQMFIFWPGWPPLSTGLSTGSTTQTYKIKIVTELLKPSFWLFLSVSESFCTLMSLFCSLRNFPTPVAVPPVPTPATNISTFPAESLHISGPVVR